MFQNNLGNSSSSISISNISGQKQQPASIQLQQPQSQIAKHIHLWNDNKYQIH